MSLNRRNFIKKCLIVGSALHFLNLSSIFSIFKNEVIEPWNGRDILYLDGIDPIVFPDKGIIIWGQKTLQSGQMALDRINARRLSIYIHKGV